MSELAKSSAASEGARLSSMKGGGCSMEGAAGALGFNGQGLKAMTAAFSPHSLGAPKKLSPLGL